MNTATLLKIAAGAAAAKAISSKIGGGASSKQVSSVLSSVLPQLLSGASKQATGKTTAASFAQALTQHGAADTKDIASFLGKVDANDGAKIVQHLLGSNSSATAKAAAQAAGVTEAQANDIMSNVAPLLMSVLGQQDAKNKKQAGSSELISSLMSGSGIQANDVMSLLGSLMK